MMDSAYLMLRYFEHKKQKRPKVIVTIKSSSETNKNNKQVKFSTPELCKAIQEEEE